MAATTFGVDFAREHLVHDFDGGLVRDTHALDEGGFLAGGLEGAGDGLTAAVDDDSLMPAASRKTTSRAALLRVAGSGESMKLPPYLTTNVWPRKRCR